MWVMMRCFVASSVLLEVLSAMVAVMLAIKVVLVTRHGSFTLGR